MSKLKISLCLIGILFTLQNHCQEDKPVKGQIYVNKDRFLANEEIELFVHGLKANQKFKLKTTTYDHRNRPWIAEAEFIASSYGFADIKNIKPLIGSYLNKDRMGLFWSATLNGIPVDSINPKNVFARNANRTYNTLIELNIDGKLIDSLNIERVFLAESVKSEHIDYNGLRGILHEPTNSKVNGAVIVMAGSDGGLSSANWRASLLASNGIPALALAYFDYMDLPEDLIEIPIETVGTAVEFLKNVKSFDRIGLLGFSKGTELSLAYCTYVENNGIDAVAVISPSSYVWQGINRNIDVKSSWTYKEEPLDFLPWKYNKDVIDMLRSRAPKRFRMMYQHSLESKENAELLVKTSLNLKNSWAPLLLIAGTEDGSWPADTMINNLIDNINKKKIPNKVEKIIIKDSGHLIFFDYLPVTDSQQRNGQDFGGTIESNIKARKIAWRETFNFFMNKL